jgi:hypothetical protein
VKEAKTAHGQAYFSDGRTLILYFHEDGSSLAAEFGKYFCNALAANPDGGSWEGCNAYLEGAAKAQPTASTLAKAALQYRLLVVPGFFSKCFSSSPAFDEGIKSLTAKGVKVDLLNVPNESSESNGRFIADHVLQQMSGSDKRKFILVGYSKGTPDIQEGLARIPALRNAVAAFVSVAGASGGSPIADAIPEIAERYLTRVEDKACLGDLASAMKSLQKSARQAFLSSYPQPFVPTYSVAAVAEPGKMSSMLARTAALLSTFDPRHDGQLTLGDATIPGSKFLGVARADHFAIALPFDKTQGQMAAGQPPFPRAALLEAILEFVSADLRTAQPQSAR